MSFLPVFYTKFLPDSALEHHYVFCFQMHVRLRNMFLLPLNVLYILLRSEFIIFNWYFDINFIVSWATNILKGWKFYLQGLFIEYSVSQSTTCCKGIGPGPISVHCEFCP